MSKFTTNNTANTAPLPSKRILFCLTGSISCYKACEILSSLSKENVSVKTIASPAALQFIGPATLEGFTKEPVYTNTFESGKMMSHIELARWADLILVCPATAKTINQLAYGVLEGLLGEVFLANNFKKPFWIAPSMNSEMLAHATTQNSLKILKSMGATILDTDSGVLACGEVGYGRLLDPKLILNEIHNFFNSSIESKKPKTSLTKKKKSGDLTKKNKQKFKDPNKEQFQ